MSNHSVFITAFAVAFTTTASAEPIDPCSLLSDAEQIELGVPKNFVPSRESQPSGVQACKCQTRRSGTTSEGTASIILSQAVPERARQLRAMQAKVREESTPAQQQARGEYFEDKVMCKVASASQQETSQCIGASEQSVVALVVSRPNFTDTVTYPASQLRIIGNLVSRVAQKDG